MLITDPAARSAARWTWVLAAIFASVALGIFSQARDFPYLYHPGEVANTQQAIAQDDRLQEPLLLPQATKALVRTTDTPLSPQPIAEKGRLVSAIFAALSVGLVVLLTGRLAGRVAGTFAGVLALTHPVLAELAHYMTKDCALLFGIVASVAAVVLYGPRPTLGSAALVGVGVGLALSASFLGVAVAIFALIVLYFNWGELVRRWVAVAVAILAMAGCFAAIHYPVLLHGGTVAQASDTGASTAPSEPHPEPIELKHTGEIGTTFSVPLLIGVAYWVGRRWKIRRHEPFAWRALGFFFFGYFFFVSLAPHTEASDLLPVYILGCALGAAGLAEWVRHYRKHRRRVTRWIPRLLALAALALHLGAWQDVTRAFEQDDRRALADWIRASVPPTAGVAHDARVFLNQAQAVGLRGFSVPNPLHAAPADGYVADLGTLKELRARGITHVVVCESDFHDTYLSSRDQMRERRKWYAELFEARPPVWHRRVGAVPYLQPGLRVYDLTW